MIYYLLFLEHVSEMMKVSVSLLFVFVCIYNVALQFSFYILYIYTGTCSFSAVGAAALSCFPIL